MKFFNKKSIKEREMPSLKEKKLNQKELEKKVIEGAERVIKQYREALTKLGDA